MQAPCSQAPHASHSTHRPAYSFARGSASVAPHTQSMRPPSSSSSPSPSSSSSPSSSLDELLEPQLPPPSRSRVPAASDALGELAGSSPSSSLLSALTRGRRRRACRLRRLAAEEGCTTQMQGRHAQVQQHPDFASSQTMSAPSVQRCICTCLSFLTTCTRCLLGLHAT